MSEKRHRLQQRRQRRKAAAEPRSAARARPADRNEADRELSNLLSNMAAMVVRERTSRPTRLAAEQWASTIVGTWHVCSMPGQDVEVMFFPTWLSWRSSSAGYNLRDPLR